MVVCSCMLVCSYHVLLCICYSVNNNKRIINQVQTNTNGITLPLLCNIVVRVLHCLSRLTMSRVKSTSASTKLRCSAALASSGSSPLIVVLLRAMILARMAAILAIGIACERDELQQVNQSINQSIIFLS